MSQDYLRIMQCGINPMTKEWITPLTKREQFAMAAMQGMLAAMKVDASRINAYSVARNSIELADALIKELDK